MTRLLRVLVGLITAILCWLAFPSSAGALVPAHPHATYTYDMPVYDAPGNDRVQERGPPGVALTNTTSDAVGPWSHGASVRPDGPVVPPVTAYDYPTALAQAARATTKTGTQVGATEGDLSSLPRAQVAANAGRFELTALGGSRYQTPAGLIYGPGSKHGHWLTHVLQHGFPDATKKTHSVFTSGSGALRTVDEAWLMRGAPDPSDLGKYVIPMGRTVGTGGETSVTVIVRPGTSQIITAYPSP